MAESAQIEKSVHAQPTSGALWQETSIIGPNISNQNNEHQALETPYRIQNETSESDTKSLLFENQTVETNRSGIAENISTPKLRMLYDCTKCGTSFLYETQKFLPICEHCIKEGKQVHSLRERACCDSCYGELEASAAYLKICGVHNVWWETGHPNPPDKFGDVYSNPPKSETSDRSLSNATTKSTKSQAQSITSAIPIKSDNPTGDVKASYEANKEGTHLLCRNCRVEIGPEQPRIRCLVCTEPFSCANCHLSGRMGGGHSYEHRFEIVQPRPSPLLSEAFKMVATPPGASASTEALSETEKPTKEILLTAPVQQATATRDKMHTDTERSAEAWTDRKWVREDGRPNYEILSIFCDVVFDYIDNMYEPFGSGKWHQEKILHGRTFWLGASAKQAVFDSIAPLRELKQGSQRDWTTLAEFCKDVVPFAAYVTEQKNKLQDTSSSRNIVNFGPRYIDFNMKTVVVDRRWLGNFYFARQRLCPQYFWAEVTEVLNVLPPQYRDRLPHGFPPKILEEPRPPWTVVPIILDQLKRYQALSYMIGHDPPETTIATLNRNYAWLKANYSADGTPIDIESSQQNR